MVSSSHGFAQYMLTIQYIVKLCNTSLHMQGYTNICTMAWVSVK